MNNIDQELLENLLEDISFINWAKKNNRNDIHYWNNWISNNESKIETIEMAKSITLGIQFNEAPLSDSKVDSQLDNVLSIISSKPKNYTKKTKLKKKFNFSPYAIAATIAVLFIFVYTSSDILNNSLVEHQTSYGEIINLTLPDGTSVILNGNSKISYSKENPRDVSLDGEAYFKVKPILSTNAKFWVSTKDLKVSVYGTKFHVNAHNQKTDVALDEGSIELELNGGKAKIMNPGEFISFSRIDKKIIHTSNSKKDSYSLWREGTYIFNNISLEEVMKNIEESYGLPSEFIDQKTKTKIISGGIPNKNLKICLSAIEKSTDTKIIKKDNKLLIINLKKDN
ncbi:FecR family protein [Maribacter sp.]|uniref:FecR family protein n=1 Tax=Maribacter sp. TaxID=1897614 RepID=UPI0025C334A8|nr:FecR family protein [Maribacter sp.]